MTDTERGGLQDVEEGRMWRRTAEFVTCIIQNKSEFNFAHVSASLVTCNLYQLVGKVDFQLVNSSARGNIKVTCNFHLAHVSTSSARLNLLP